MGRERGHRKVFIKRRMRMDSRDIWGLKLLRLTDKMVTVSR